MEKPQKVAGVALFRKPPEPARNALEICPERGAYLHLAGIAKCFGSRAVLSDISLTAKKGEMLCILGPSGCGKTTLLRIIAGLEAPDRGALWLAGRDISDIPPEARGFGFVFQNYALFPNLTLAENVAYGLHGRGKEERRRKVAELLALVHLADYAGHYPGRLSGGQQQRAALARALAPDPALLLLDEPLSALDAQVRGRLREDLRRIQKALGISAVLVTHDQQEALALADRIVVMNQGRIEQLDTPEALYHSPKTHFVAEFIGSMNVLSPLPGALSAMAGAEGRPIGIRYEDVIVDEITEARLKDPCCFVARIESNRLFGPFRRLELLLNDQTTRIFADIPATRQFKGLSPEQATRGLVAVTLPQNRWRRWNDA